MARRAWMETSHPRTGLCGCCRAATRDLHHRRFQLPARAVSVSGQGWGKRCQEQVPGCSPALRAHPWSLGHPKTRYAGLETSAEVSLLTTVQERGQFDSDSNKFQHLENHILNSNCTSRSSLDIGKRPWVLSPIQSCQQTASRGESTSNHFKDSQIIHFCLAPDKSN